MGLDLNLNLFFLLGFEFNEIKIKRDKVIKNYYIYKSCLYKKK